MSLETLEAIAYASNDIHTADLLGQLLDARYQRDQLIERVQALLDCIERNKIEDSDLSEIFTEGVEVQAMRETLDEVQGAMWDEA